MSMFLSVKALREKGEPKKTIARRLGLDPRTVRKWVRRIEAGVEEPAVERPSKLEAYRSVIKTKVEADCSAVQIYDHLVSTIPGFDASYETVKRLVRQLRPVEPEVFRRLTFAPGEEAQVDFGDAGRMIVQGRFRRVWLFCMTLCYSRMTHREYVLDQTVPTFLGAILRGFEKFGGVPRRLKPDNLKAAVLLNHLGERLYQRDFFAMCRHVGCTPDPARPRTPTDKGRVERDIGYVRSSHLRGRVLGEFEAEQEALARWSDEVANRRVHGSLRRRPCDLFEEERGALLPLPDEPFEISVWGKYKVRKDCHVHVGGNFYSVPHRHVGTEVAVRVREDELAIFADDSVIATHARLLGKGGSATNEGHYPETKRLASQEIHRLRLLKIRSAGPESSRFISCLKESRMVFADQLIRVAKLIDTHGEAVVEQACRRALHFGATDSAMRLQRIIEKGLQDLPLPFSGSLPASPDDFGRDLCEYEALLSGGHLV